MKVIIKADELSRVLERVAPARQNRPVVPSAGQFLLQVMPCLNATCTDTSLFVTAKTEEVDILEGGDLLVDPILGRIVGAAGEAELTLTYRDDKLYVSGWGEATLPTMDADLFPLRPDVDMENGFPFETRYAKILAVSAQTEKLANPKSSGVHVLPTEEGCLLATTTQGFWMSSVFLEDVEAKEMLFPLAHLDTALKGTKDPFVSLGDKVFVWDESSWASFPPFEQQPMTAMAVFFEWVEPIAHTEVDLAEFDTVLAIAGQFSDSAATVKLLIENGSLRVQALGNELGEFSQSIRAKSKGIMEMSAYNSRILRAALSTMQEPRIEFYARKDRPEHLCLVLSEDNVKHAIQMSALRK